MNNVAFLFTYDMNIYRKNQVLDPVIYLSNFSEYNIQHFYMFS